MNSDSIPTPAELRKLLRYEHDTGLLFWHSGKLALNCSSRNGYKSGRVLGDVRSAHRVIWAMVHDEWPDQIDHINHDILDNRIANLRNVSIKDNNKNRPMQANNKSGVCGVSWGKKENMWKAQIGINGKSTLLGCYQDFDEAVRVRKDAEKRHGFHSKHGESK